MPKLPQEIIDWLEERNQHRTFGKTGEDAIICPETRTYFPIELSDVEVVAKLDFCPLCGKELGYYVGPMEDGSFHWEH